MVVLPRLAGKWLARMDARWKIEHVKLDVPPDYLLFKNQKLGWASVSLVRFSSILFLAYQLIPTRARNASRAFAAKCCGAAQLHCASNLYIYFFYNIYIYLLSDFAVPECWMVQYDRYNSAVSACSSAPWARVAKLLSCNSAARVASYWMLLADIGCCWSSWQIVWSFVLKCDELCLQIFVHVELVWQGVSRPRCWEPGWASTFDCDKFSSIYLLQEH